MQMMEITDHDRFSWQIGETKSRLARIVNDSGLQAVFGFRCVMRINQASLRHAAVSMRMLEQYRPTQSPLLTPWK
jgi:hypothetical protein